MYWDDLGKAILFIIVFSLIIAGSYLYSLIGQMNNVRQQSGARDYMVDGSFHLQEKSDRFMYSHTTRVRVQTNNGGASGQGRPGGPGGRRRF